MYNNRSIIELVIVIVLVVVVELCNVFPRARVVYIVVVVYNISLLDVM